MNCHKAFLLSSLKAHDWYEMICLLCAVCNYLCMNTHSHTSVYVRSFTDLTDLFGTALSEYLVHPAASVQLLAERPELSFSVLHVCFHLFQALHSIAVQLLPAAGLLCRLIPGHLELFCLCISGYLVNTFRPHSYFLSLSAIDIMTI